MILTTGKNLWQQPLRCSAHYTPNRTKASCMMMCLLWTIGNLALNSSVQRSHACVKNCMLLPKSFHRWKKLFRSNGWNTRRLFKSLLKRGTNGFLSKELNILLLKCAKFMIIKSLWRCWIFSMTSGFWFILMKLRCWTVWLSWTLNGSSMCSRR